MCVYLYARNSMIDIDDVFNRLSYINYSYQSIQTNKNGVGAFFML
ncbi:hypothetical protein [Staphylococcus epidermidis]|nr:hypothetical protein [Staphylococcus epidermidis]EHM73394.1 hypothetical protein HMPREF9956_2529 [Staphylococcus epidermidis 14.1.R1.SE]EHR82676.1 hypothetical protein SEVCU118_1920 [Staphylococcus epidermidis VCU118]EHR99254.1 hypothetical protein SEVCU128_0860 [Staphylococcus epidermidis VCU128]EFV88040.1 hypothetical protein GSEF_2094 [Staphylococcus epidermidis FRI909]MDU0472039.1 hypothetical protein [Staphylococcus epidermidis]